MKLHRLIAALAALVFGVTLAPSVTAQTTPNVFDVKLYLVDNPGTSTETLTELTTTPPLQVTGTAVNLDADVPAGGAKRYLANGVEVFQIARCAGCANRARVFVSTGSINRLVVTDAQITNIKTPAATLTLRIVASSGDLPISGPGGDYPFATELSGTFTAPLGQSATDPANRITVNSSATDECDGTCRIDNPFTDPGEEGNPFARYSIVAPPFLAGGLAQFAPKEQDILPCSNVSVCVPVPGSDSCTNVYSCQPLLGMSVDFTLKSRHGARIPGSVGAFHVPERCEPDNGLFKGCEVMAEFFASLGPKGFRAWFARLEPSPGPQRTIDLRDGTTNSPEAWVTKRGERDDDCDDDNDAGSFSNTRARLFTNGSGVVKASGLCPASGCPSSNILPVRVYCRSNIISTTAIRLNEKGNGKADLSFSLPCPDPAVVIMDSSDANWVAAPAIF